MGSGRFIKIIHWEIFDTNLEFLKYLNACSTFSGVTFSYDIKFMSKSIC